MSKPDKKRVHAKVKSQLHPRSKHRERYDFAALIADYPELANFVKPNRYNDDSIDFADPAAVKALNAALLKHHYGVSAWNIPEGYLVPPIPGRADYLHYVVDLMRTLTFGNMPTGGHIRCLDLGVGSSCIYPLIGNSEYGWSFVGTEIDKTALESAEKILAQNPHLKGKIELRLQARRNDILYNVVQQEERFDVSICNPPFHSSGAEATAASARKVTNLSGKKTSSPVLNFGGQQTELWCEGGEQRFISDLVRQSRTFGQSCCWFTTLVAKQTHLKGVYKALKSARAVDIKTIPMGQGNKTSRIIAWTFLTRQEQKQWALNRKWGGAEGEQAQEEGAKVEVIKVQETKVEEPKVKVHTVAMPEPEVEVQKTRVQQPRIEVEVQQFKAGGLKYNRVTERTVKPKVDQPQTGAKVEKVEAVVPKVSKAAVDKPKVEKATAAKPKVEKAKAAPAKVEKATPVKPKAAKAKAVPAKVEKAKPVKAKVAKTTADKPKVAKATTAKPKVEKVKAVNEKVAKATVDKPKVAKATAAKPKVEKVKAVKAKVAKTTVAKPKAIKAAAAKPKAATTTATKKKAAKKP